VGPVSITARVTLAAWHSDPVHAATPCDSDVIASNATCQVALSVGTLALWTGANPWASHFWTAYPTDDRLRRSESVGSWFGWRTTSSFTGWPRGSPVSDNKQDQPGCVGGCEADPGERYSLQRVQ